MSAPVDPPDLIFNIADDLRRVTMQALREGGCDIPARSYVEIGSPLAPVGFGDDCMSQLTVIAGPFQPDLITQAMQGRQGKRSCAMLWKCKFTVTLLRCHPLTSGMETAPLPTPAQVDTQARLHYADAWQIARVLAWRWSHGELVESYSFDCENTQWGSVSVRAPQGGIRGWDLDLTVSVHDQYQPEELTEPFD